jgi:3-dehydroquinate dehydratase / shikimate dehydrogenase
VELFETLARAWPDRALLCATVAADTMAGQVAERDRVATRADLVELRLDAAVDPDPARGLAERSTPVLVTCRSRAEGGCFAGSEAERLTILETALDAGADLIDVEWSSAGKDRLLARAPDRVVVSMHDFSGIPTDLDARTRAMLGSPARFVKIAVAVSSLRDVLRLGRLARLAADRPRLVLIGMGESGLPSRVLAARFGSAWSYAGPGLAPGQVSVERLDRELGFGRLGPATRLFGLVGRPVAHSVSPAMHNAAFAAAGLDAVYVPLDAADFDDFAAFAAATGVEGVSVTAPYKAAALAAARGEESAMRSGAANTLRRAGDGAWDACNTDVHGFLAPLAQEALAGRRVTVLGAGGAARAVVLGLASRHAEITVVARQPDRARDVAALAGAAWAAWPPAPGSWDLLVNTTPVGTWPDTGEAPVDADALTGALVYDLVYNPPDTALLRAARARGLRTIGGFEMLAAQAARQFEWWTGQGAPFASMREAGIEALRRRRSEA